jgi:hypothetical protein
LRRELWLITNVVVNVVVPVVAASLLVPMVLGKVIILWIPVLLVEDASMASIRHIK